MLQKINWSAISPDESEKLKNELVEVWEASVRSTHRFLTEKVSFIIMVQAGS